ncbi:thiopeptide-type bacteriocin biosynthesis protein [Streptomyces sp. FBKL.4005]|uniref:thiopeptide-type bacteriocin biosynthesis protein n=1 Tax=Streptomyces sp. FBKL.4005 TaxID=2015515 RepID=UPI001CB90A96|nr:thiopeptide-type bacteriocin biosynthesis protein [Streptomyces sp. FBKL.4005]
MRTHPCETGWVQLNLARHPSRTGPPPYHRLATTARELLTSGQASNFFFMHKPPGLRVRFQAADPDQTAHLREELLRRLDPVPGQDPWTPPTPGVYEPETYLFGGPASMPWVHALFTADSLAWLDLHTHHAGTPPPPAWRLSLTLLHTVFTALHITGWEHRGVWQTVKEETGRRLPGGLNTPDRRRAAAGIRAWWEQTPTTRLHTLPPAWHHTITTHAQTAEQAAQHWHTHYFTTAQATTGPRRAAAHHVIFHWNRAALPTTTQCLLTEALATTTHDHEDTHQP